MQAYGEELFQYFLAIERARAERFHRPVLLVLVESREPFDARTTRRLFGALGRCLRETDLIGWYREEHVIGAVLTELNGRCAADVAHLIAPRIRRALDERLPSTIARHVQLRIQSDPGLEGRRPEPEPIAGGTRCSS